MSVAPLPSPESSGETQITVIVSSHGRLWDGFDASVYDVTAGSVEQPPQAMHTVLLHLSSSVIQGAWRCDGRLMHRMVKPGDIDFIPLGTRLAWCDKSDGRIANLRIGPALMSETAATLGHSDMAAVSLSPRLGIDDEILRSLLLAIVDELWQGGNGPLFAKSVVTAVASHLLRCYGEVFSKVVPRKLSRRQLSRIVDYIEANLSRNLSYADIAAVAGVSPSYLKVLFKQAVGVPVHQYVVKRRVEYAVSLLSQGTAALSDIAEQAGFADQSHMARCMRRVMRTTPAAYLRSIRG
jgi:AraC family transcriptional regulator